MTKTTRTYTEALSELEKIVKELENGAEINMEIVAEKVKRAVALLDTCKKHLHEIDVDLEKILNAIA